MAEDLSELKFRHFSKKVWNQATMITFYFARQSSFSEVWVYRRNKADRDSQ
jgi:hypothetical protein